MRQILIDFIREIRICWLWHKFESAEPWNKSEWQRRYFEEIKSRSARMVERLERKRGLV